MRGPERRQPRRSSLELCIPISLSSRYFTLGQHRSLRGFWVWLQSEENLMRELLPLLLVDTVYWDESKENLWVCNALLCNHLSVFSMFCFLSCLVSKIFYLFSFKIPVLMSENSLVVFNAPTAAAVYGHNSGMRIKWLSLFSTFSPQYPLCVLFSPYLRQSGYC